MSNERINIEGYDVDVEKDRDGKVVAAHILSSEGAVIRSYQGPSAVTNAKKWTLR